MTEKNYKWIHIGGGTSLSGSDSHPCDDQYEHEDTKKTFVVICTQEAHKKMPKRVRKPSDLKRWVGVKSITFSKLDAPKEDASEQGQVSEPPAVHLPSTASDTVRVEQGA